MIKLAIIGANGKMGQIVQEAIATMENIELVAKITKADNLAIILDNIKPDIAIDVSSHEVVKQNTWTILQKNIFPVVGASGLSLTQIDELTEYCKQQQRGALIIPNFSMAFAFINKVTKEFAQYYKDISIVEFHHAQKKDHPSGTAKYTAKIAGIKESSIASIRSNGFLAKQQLYINSDSERIIIDHESFNRRSFIDGIKLSLNKVRQLKELIIGLENLIGV